MKETRRIAYLDGLRGVAALQVVALHYASAFLPAIAMIDATRARHGWETLFIDSPMFFPMDGYSAVYLFFLISGAALTYSFQGKPWALIAGATRRLIRLGVPMAASVVFAACLLSLIPAAHVEAGHLSGSDDWMTVIGPHDLGLWSTAREVVMGGMIAGHAGLLSTMLPDRLVAAFGLSPKEEAFNAPLWTLHFEFYGSLVVLCLVAARASLTRLNHAILCVVLLILLTAHPMALFVIGHMLAPVIASPAWSAITTRRVMPILGVGTVLAAIVLSTYHPIAGLVDPAMRIGGIFHTPGRFNNFHFQRSVVALLLFVGVMMALPLQRILRTGPCQWLGRISFSLYLTHFPILFTIAAPVYVAAGGESSGALLATGVGLAVTIPIACLFEQSVDRLAIRISRRIPRSGSWFRRHDKPEPTLPPAGTNA